LTEYGKKKVLAWRKGGKLETLPRQPYSELSSEPRNFECDTDVQPHVTGNSFERGILLDSPGSRCRPIHLVGNYELWFSIKGQEFFSFGTLIV
jgi:hypothetical protein